MKKNSSTNFATAQFFVVAFFMLFIWEKQKVGSWIENVDAAGQRRRQHLSVMNTFGNSVTSVYPFMQIRRSAFSTNTWTITAAEKRN